MSEESRPLTIEGFRAGNHILNFNTFKAESLAPIKGAKQSWNIAKKDVKKEGKINPPCRLCLNVRSWRYYKIFGLRWVNRPLHDLIMRFTGISISADDDMPKSICDKCHRIMNKFSKRVSVWKSNQDSFLKKQSIEVVVSVNPLAKTPVLIGN